MVLTIINTCNRDCPFCFEGDFRLGPEKMMSPDDVDRLCEFFRLGEASPEQSVSILGGEPTLHPQLLEIIDVIQSHNPNIQILLLTNLTCSTELLGQVLMRNVRLLVNLVPPSLNTPEQQQAVEANTALLREAVPIIYAVAATISSLDENFDYLYDYLRADCNSQVYNVRLGLSSPGLDCRNEFVSEPSPEWGEKYLEVVRNIHQINPQIRIGNECAINFCFISEETYDILNDKVAQLNLRCTEPNLDILPDFSTHWCFGTRHIPGMRIDNIFDYPSAEHLVFELKHRKANMMRKIGNHCGHESCEKLRCHGCCLALNYHYMREKQEKC